MQASTEFSRFVHIGIYKKNTSFIGRKNAVSQSAMLHRALSDIEVVAQTVQLVQLFKIILCSFDTTTPGFVFSDQYLQLTLALPSANVYGFGEHNHRRFQHDMNWKKWPIFTRDVAPVVCQVYRRSLKFAYTFLISTFRSTSLQYMH